MPVKYPLRRVAGLGTDIVSIQRIAKAYSKHSTRFVQRILHPDEQEIFHGLSSSPTRQHSFLAGRWAAKEATLKALGYRLPANTLCIVPDPQGGSKVPRVTLYPTTELHKKRVEEGKMQGMVYESIHVSISHEETHAISTVIVEEHEQVGNVVPVCTSIAVTGFTIMTLQYLFGR
eukprot:TRINITY_DN1800_c0_g1_i1.p1 TRINITY_DN1800_c0_g1~~TRINITY_DN1800_c0_g1_i1.p1  ORF type:complete len:175 (+),score=19.99 TRINITY_DN1800_c0_g1_i1:185-709(+)